MWEPSSRSNIGLEEDSLSGVSNKSCVQLSDVSSETLDNSAQQEILNTDAISRVSEARRNLISKVQQKKNSKLNKKIPAEKQMIAMAKEDLSLKNRIVEQMEKAEQKHQANMSAFAKGISSLNDIH